MTGDTNQPVGKRPSGTDGMLKVILPALIALIGVFVMAYATLEVPRIPIRATQTAEARQTQVAQGTRAVTPTANLIDAPTGAPALTSTSLPLTPSLTPPASIDNPRCERRENVSITHPTNGSSVNGVIEIRGRLKTRGVGSKWYALYFHEGIARQPMTEDYHRLVPRPKTSPVEGNVLIKYVDYPPDQEDGMLGVWDTTKLTPGWYTLRVWYEEINAQFLACDVYVLVAP